MEFKVLCRTTRRLVMPSPLSTMSSVPLPVRMAWRATSDLDRQKYGQLAQGGAPPLLSRVGCDAAHHARRTLPMALNSLGVGTRAHRRAARLGKPATFPAFQHTAG